jgi:Holliday junction DNA helicase RuvB
LSANLEIFSPKNFDEYIGQDRAKKIAKVMLSASSMERRPLPNILIDGSYGLGKTSLAKVIFNELKIKPRIIDASALNKIIPPILTRQAAIIDEIHNLDPQVADTLNILIDEGKLSIIGCTTNPGMLPAPFRSRFRNVHLDPYTQDQISKILRLALDRKLVPAPDRLVSEISKRSRLNPRVGLNYLAFIFDIMTVRHESTLSERTIKEAFQTLGVDNKGFIDRDYKYMEALQEERPVGLQYLSAMIGVDAKTIETEIEPYLLQTGHIDRMPRGRIKLKEI